MGLLVQNSSIVADPTKMSVSRWIYAKTSETTLVDNAFGCLDFGDGDHDYSFCSLNLAPDAECFHIGLASSYLSATLTTFNDDPTPDAHDPVSVYMDFQSTLLPSGTLRDKWVHLFYAIDIENKITYTNPYNSNTALLPKVDLYINGVNRLLLVAGVREPPVIFFVRFASTSILEAFYSDLEDGGTYELESGWKLGTNGLPFAIPQRAEFIEGFPPIHMAETKIWFGTYIDPAMHMDKFLSTTGRAVDPSAAISAFGTPAYHFRRRKAANIQFSTNLGTAGPMTQVGTIADFFPGVP
jgi:hypothetical protein